MRLKTGWKQDVLHDEAHVWFITPESVGDPSILQRCHAMLDAHERERLGRFFRADDRHHYLVSHALVRTVLSKYADIPPACWIFSHGKHGRPEIKNQNTPALRFNLTHTAGLVGCVVTLKSDCGIDAEKTSPRHNPLSIAKRMFSDAEFRELQQLKGLAHLEYFFRRWTLREAYVKALGIGISFPTRKLDFEIDSEDSTSVMFHADLRENDQDWQFQLLRPTPEHIAAVAIRISDTGRKKLITRFIEL